MVFSCVALSAGMPLLTLLMAAFLYVRFHSVKYHLLRYWEKPRRYDEELGQNALNILIWAVPLHCIFGIWMFSKETLTSGVKNQERHHGMDLAVLPQTLPFAVSLGLSLLYILFRLFEELFADETPAGERLKDFLKHARQAPLIGLLTRILFPEHDDELQEGQ